MDNNCIWEMEEERLMAINKFAVVLILLSAFLLNSPVTIAQDQSSQGVQKIVSKKEEAIQKKFVEFKKWIQEQKPAFDKWFTDNLVKLKQEMGRLFKQITEKLQKFQDKNYTRMKKVNPADALISFLE